MAEPFDLSDFISDDGGVLETKEFEPPPPPAAPRTSSAFIASGVPTNGTVSVSSDDVSALRHEFALLKAQLVQLEERSAARAKALTATVLESADLQAALQTAQDHSAVFYGFLAGTREKKYSLYAELPFDATTGIEKPFIRPKYEKKGANWLCLSYPRVAQQVMHKQGGTLTGTAIHLWYVVRVVNKSGEFERLWICDKASDGASTFVSFQMFVDASAASKALATGSQ